MIAANMITHPRISFALSCCPRMIPSGKYGDAGFQTEDQGCHSGVHVLLTDDLQSIGNTAGHDTCIKDGHAMPARIAGNSWGCSRIRAGMADRIPQVRNWMQESFTPSAFGEKWSMTRICMENKNAHTSTSRSPFPMENPSVMHRR